MIKTSINSILKNAVICILALLTITSSVIADNLKVGNQMTSFLNIADCKLNQNSHFGGYYNDYSKHQPKGHSEWFANNNLSDNLTTQTEYIQSAIDSVPEPGSILALSTGLIGIAGFIKRKRF